MTYSKKHAHIRFNLFSVGKSVSGKTVKQRSKKYEDFYEKLDKEYAKVPRLDKISREAIAYVGISPQTLLHIQNGTIHPSMFNAIYNYLSTNSSMQNQESQEMFTRLTIEIALFTSLLATFIAVLPSTIEFSGVVRWVFGFIFILLILDFLHGILEKFKMGGEASELTRKYNRAQDWIAKEYGIIIPWDPDEMIELSEILRPLESDASTTKGCVPPPPSATSS